MERCRGIIIWFSSTKGFGFIHREGGPDVFCYRGALEPDVIQALRDGDVVEFDLTGPEGRYADNVVLVRA